MSIAYHFHFPPQVVDSMGWQDFIGFVDQCDEFERQRARAEANRGLGNA